METHLTSQLCIALLYAGITLIMRLLTKDSFFVSRILDGGAVGMIVTHINPLQDTRDVVNAANFQPIGHPQQQLAFPTYNFGQYQPR
jgi:4-hydroxy-2-oxoheptanedioate aldolase